MAWIEVHQSLRDHRKTIELAELLGMSEACAVGHLIFIWLWALDNASDGLLSITPQVIAKIAGFRGDANTFQSALISAGYIDQVGDRLFIHDWFDYAGKLLDKRRKDADRKRLERASNGCPSDGAGTVPNSTVPNHTKRTVVVSVFDYWCAVMAKDTRTRLDTKRETVIRRALNVLSEDECKLAIDGCAASDWHMGRDPRNKKKYNDLNLIFRDAEHWEKFIEEAEQSKKAKRGMWDHESEGDRQFREYMRKKKEAEAEAGEGEG